MGLLDKFKKPKMVEALRLMSDNTARNSIYTNLDANIDNVLARRGYQLYSRDMMSDDQVKACVVIKKLGVTIGGYSIQAAVGESDPNYAQAKEIADFISYVFTNMKGSIPNVLYNVANAIVVGFSVNEIIWKLIDEEGSPYKGFVGLQEIKIKPSETITFELDANGNVLNLVQTIQGIKTYVPLDKVLLYTYDPQSTGMPQGVSDLRAAYKHYWSKDALMRFRNVAAEKYASPTAVGKYPPHFTKKQQMDLLNAIKKIAIDSAIVVPEGTEITLLEAKGSVVMPYDASIDTSNRGIARAIFGQVLATDEGKESGSFAQAKIHKGILGMFLTGLRDEIADHVIYEQLIKKLVDYNYGIPLYPKMVLAPPDEKDLQILVNVMDKLLVHGVVEKNEPFIREEFGFPPKPKELIDREQQQEQQNQETTTVIPGGENVDASSEVKQDNVLGNNESGTGSETV